MQSTVTYSNVHRGIQNGNICPKEKENKYKFANLNVQFNINAQ